MQKEPVLNNIDQGLFAEAYSMLKKNPFDVFLLIESCINMKKFSEAKNLFNNINKDTLSTIDLKKYYFTEILILHSDEQYQTVVDRVNFLIDHYDYSLREKIVLIIEMSFCLRKLSHYDTALKVLLPLEDEILKLSAYYQGQFRNSLGLIFWSKGKLNEALEYFQISFLNFQSVKNEAGMARALNNQANVYNDLGDLDNALVKYKQAINIHTSLGNTFDLGIVYNNIAVIHQKKGLLGDAINYYQKALELMNKVKNMTYQAVLHTNIGSLECDRGNLTESLTHLEIAKKIFSDSQQLKHLSTTLSIMAYLFFEGGDYEKGLTVILDSLTIEKDLKNTLDILISIYTLYWYTFSLKKEFDDNILNLLNLIPGEVENSKNIELYMSMIKSILDMKDNNFDKAKSVLEDIKDKEGIEFNNKIMVLKSLAIAELELLIKDTSEDNFSSFIRALSEIKELCDKNNLVSSHCEILAIQANFENSVLLFTDSLESLKSGLELAKNSGLSKYVTYFEEKIKIQTSNINNINYSKKDISKIDINEIKDYILTINQIIKN